MREVAVKVHEMAPMLGEILTLETGKLEVLK